jgi:hypothetical protein
MEAFATNPSQCHLQLLEKTKPALRYTGGDLVQWQGKVREKIRSLLGVPDQPREPLRVHQLWQREHELGTITKIVFNSEPGADIPAFLCLPRNVKPPYRTFICLQGHSTGMHNSIAVAKADESTPLAVQGDRDFGLSAMRYGLAALCVEQRGFGQRQEHALPGTPKEPRCHEPAMHAMMLGRTLIGERVFDVDRAIDYLYTRNDIDLNHIGCMGNSGGGSATTYASLLLDRLTGAICSCSFASWRGSIMGVYHCICNYIPGIALQVDMGDILAAVAPKPLVVVSGVQDNIFDINTARSEFRRVQQAYTQAGTPEKCRMVEGPEGHRFYADLAWPAMLDLWGTPAPTIR